MSCLLLVLIFLLKPSSVCNVGVTSVTAGSFIRMHEVESSIGVRYVVNLMQ